jgi:hypothetical protein
MLVIIHITRDARSTIHKKQKLLFTFYNTMLLKFSWPLVVLFKTCIMHLVKDEISYLSAVANVHETKKKKGLMIAYTNPTLGAKKLVLYGCALLYTE